VIVQSVGMSLNTLSLYQILLVSVYLAGFPAKSLQEALYSETDLSKKLEF
jgi:hypothetical protein